MAMALDACSCAHRHSMRRFRLLGLCSRRCGPAGASISTARPVGPYWRTPPPCPVRIEEPGRREQPRSHTTPRRRAPQSRGLGVGPSPDLRRRRADAATRATMTSRFNVMAAFIAVADAEGFALAARRLGPLPSAMTRLVAGLEERSALPAKGRALAVLAFTARDQHVAAVSPPPRPRSARRAPAR